MEPSTDHAEPENHGPQNPCPQCGGETEIGFGLAGGGYGVYLYCDACEDIVSKTQCDD